MPSWNQRLGKKKPSVVGFVLQARGEVIDVGWSNVDRHAVAEQRLDDLTGKPLVIVGLWTLTLGGGANSSSDTLYFTAGPNGQTDGLFGTITPVSKGEDE